MYTVIGATGNIGSVITKTLLEKGEKVRVFGRHGGKLQVFAQNTGRFIAGCSCKNRCANRVLIQP